MSFGTKLAFAAGATAAAVGLWWVYGARSSVAQAAAEARAELEAFSGEPDWPCFSDATDEIYTEIKADTAELTRRVKRIEALAKRSALDASPAAHARAESEALELREEARELAAKIKARYEILHRGVAKDVADFVAELRKNYTNYSKYISPEELAPAYRHLDTAIGIKTRDEALAWGEEQQEISEKLTRVYYARERADKGVANAADIAEGGGSDAFYDNDFYGDDLVAIVAAAGCSNPAAKDDGDDDGDGDGDGDGNGDDDGEGDDDDDGDEGDDDDDGGDGDDGDGEGDGGGGAVF